MRVSSLFLMAILVALAPISSHAAESNPPRIVSVSGIGTVTLPAAYATLNVGVEATAKTASEAQKQVAEKANSVVKYLKNQEAQKLYTTGVSLNPQYDYQPDGKPPVLRGFSASNTVSARFHVDKAGKVLDGVVQAGATSIPALSFEADKESIAAARLQAIGKAVENAKAQAEAALSAIDAKMEGVQRITIGGETVSQPPVLYAAQMAKADMAGAEAAPSSPVMGQEQRVEMSVSIDVRY